jgi:hypothetical protein
MAYRAFCILMILVVGLWSPLCCCQAGLLAASIGGGTDGLTAHEPAAERCGCCDKPHPEDRPSTPPAPMTPCDDCAVCTGGGTPGLTGAGAVQSPFDDGVPALGFVLPTPPSAAGPPRADRTRGETTVKQRRSGRDVLRWHCALTV